MAIVLAIALLFYEPAVVLFAVFVADKSLVFTRRVPISVEEKGACFFLLPMKRTNARHFRLLNINRYDSSTSYLSNFSNCLIGIILNFGVGENHLMNAKRSSLALNSNIDDFVNMSIFFKE